MGIPSNERTLTAALLPKDVATIDTVVTTAFRNIIDCVDFAALSHSIVLDFLVRSAGASHVRLSLLNRLPVIAEDCPSPLRNALRVPTSTRTLLLDYPLHRAVGERLRH